jgi:type VI secretion system secreted protein VgrG
MDTPADTRAVRHAQAAERIEVALLAFELVDGPSGPWHVRRVHWSEGLCEPYEIVVDLVTDAVDVVADDLLGASAELTLERGDLTRCAYGIVERVQLLGTTTGRLAVRVHVVPAFALLDQEIDSRIFQDMTAPEILEAVLGPTLEEYGRGLGLELEREYDKRDYCVQYRESLRAFACRLMEEEGIAYGFHHDEESRAEVLVLADGPGAWPDVPTLADPEIPVIVDRPDTADRESLRHFDWCRVERVATVASRGFNWKKPDARPEGDAAGEHPRGRARAVYDHDDRRHIVDDGSDDAFAGETDQRGPIAKRRLEALACDAKRGVGRSNVTGFSPGRIFTVGVHEHPEVDGARFLLVRVVHEAECPEEDLGSEAYEGDRYGNRFECVPADVPYRPRPTIPRPRTHGPDTAIVTGPPGEEIHVDAHGRIKVKFHWDRLGEDDDTSSCWVRVAQSWGGMGWGSWFVPRVGMEVVVDFLDGNPDRPIVVGCVYNGTNGLPYTLPDEKTKSTIKTQSSPGGDGFNELRFEDAAGSEEIWIHAQKDLNIKVLNDENTSVDIHQTLTVGGNQTVVIDGNQTITVKGDPAQPEGGGGGGGGGGFKGSSTDVSGDYKVTASQTVFMSAPDKITLECPGSSIVLEPGKITLTAGGGASIVLDGNALMQSSAGSSVLLDGNACAKSSGGSSVLLDGNACMTSSGGSTVLLDGNALVAAAAGGSALLDANATITGATATVASTSGGFVELTANADLGGAVCTCAGDGASVTLTANVEINGASVSSTASGTNAVTGATVTLN